MICADKDLFVKERGFFFLFWVILNQNQENFVTRTVCPIYYNKFKAGFFLVSSNTYTYWVEVLQILQV